MDDIYYTNIMLELEKLSDRLNRVECKFDALKDELSQDVPKVKSEDFSRFLNFDKQKTVDFKNFGSFHLGAVADSDETKYVCIWENLKDEDRTKPMGISCPCKKCSPYSMS